MTGSNGRLRNKAGLHDLMPSTYQILRCKTSIPTTESYRRKAKAESFDAAAGCEWQDRVSGTLHNTGLPVTVTIGGRTATYLYGRRRAGRSSRSNAD